MSKARKSNKETKKQPVLTFKEKRIKKQNKQEDGINPPVIFPPQFFQHTGK